MIQESAPPGKKAKTWIKHRTPDFKKRYGKSGSVVMTPTNEIQFH
jgi:hypothetical protein